MLKTFFVSQANYVSPITAGRIMNAITFYRLAHWMYGHHVPMAPKVLQLLILLLFNCYIPYGVEIGRGARVGHRGIGVVVNKDTWIGRNVLLRAHITIGKISPDAAAPIIEDNVEIGDGAKILGAVRIGAGAKIGANAVVITDVPAGATAVGVPARIVESVIR